MFFSEDMVQAAPPVQNAQPVHVAPQRSAQPQPTPQRQVAGRSPVAYPTNANHFEKEPRRVKEIRVFYDDGTFEVFAPAGK